MLVEYHRNLLADKTRNDAFYSALQSVIKKGETIVADIGSGTGLLGFMASRLGAKEIYLYEFGGVIDLAKRLAKTNKIERLHFIPQHSNAVKKPVSVDVIVSETLGNFALEEHIIDTIENAKRFLKPGGAVIPNRIENFAALVTAPRFHKDLTIWDDVGFGLDYSPAKTMSFNNLYVRTFAPTDLLGPGQLWDTVDFTHKNSSRRRGTLEWILDTDATLYGLCVWWDCTLTKDIHLSTSPFAPKTHWEQLYFPIETPLQARKGDRLTATIESHSSYKEGTIIGWDITLNGKTQSHNLRDGYIG